MSIINQETKKTLEKTHWNGSEIFTCPKCKKVHEVSAYVYAQMGWDLVTHTCDCGQKTCFYKNEMWHKNL